MLPGFRFLLAATLLTISLLVFGLGAAALLRASHERFASLPKQPVLAPVFTQTVDAAPSTLSMLRVEQAPDVDTSAVAGVTPRFDTLLPTDRIATLSIAPRVEEPAPAPPVVIEPEPEVKAEMAQEPPKVEGQPEPAPEPVQNAAPVAPPVEPAAIAKMEEPAKIETPATAAPKAASSQIAAVSEPEMTGSTPAPQIGIEPPLINAKPIRKPPTPRDRPIGADVVAALPGPVAAASAPDIARPAIRRRKPAVKRALVKPKRRVVSRPAPQRPAVQNPVSPFGAAPFGT